MVYETDLLTLDSVVNAPEGIVYSTSPRRAEGMDGHSYFVKGPDIEVAFAELTGCSFAIEVGLIVPEVAVCSFNNEKYCGSRKVPDSLRDVAAWLKRPQKIRNRNELYAVIVVDAWLGNTDRNLGNVLGRSTHGSEIEVVMIDFEKSKALRPNPIIESGMMSPQSLWPTGELGQVLKATRPLLPPQQIVDRIRQVTRPRCKEIIDSAVSKLGPVAWADNSVEVVSRRAGRITEIVGDVWRLN
jgi:hypothetical protein